MPLAWNWDPLILCLLVIPAVAYLDGLNRQCQRRQAGLHRMQKWRAAAFGTGIITLFVVLISPVDLLSERLFSIHMFQHILLMDVAAPLLAFSAPLGALLSAFPQASQHAIGRWWAAPRNWARGIWHWASRPFVAWMLFAGFLWIWHIPVLYGAAVAHDIIHAIEHFCFLGSGLLFWWNVFHVFWRKPGSRGGGVFYMALYALQSSGLGALLSLSNTPWYPIYAVSTKAFNISPLADQQAAGAMMWLPETAVYMIGALTMLRGWLGSMRNAEERRRHDETTVVQDKAR